jgi:large subunit ribosomal protein L24
LPKVLLPLVLCFAVGLSVAGSRKGKDMRKIKRGDEVVVIAGKDKSRRGAVVKVLGERFIVSGINMVKKHQKPNPATNQSGGIIEKEAPIAASNVAIFNVVTGKSDRVGFKIRDDGTKVRIFKSSSERIDV